MLRTTFLFLPRISHRTEQLLARQGITDWHAFLQQKTIKGISTPRLAQLKHQLLNAQQALLKEDAS